MLQIFIEFSFPGTGNLNTLFDLCKIPTQRDLQAYTVQTLSSDLS